MSAQKRPSRKAEQSQATRAALVHAGRTLFAERGYAAVPTEEIARASGVTRGALYHQFADKQDLFRAVYEQLEGELVEQVLEQASSSTDPLQALQAGAAAFLDACDQQAVRRIVLIEAPSVLGWALWREIGLSHGLGLIEQTLQAGMQAGLIERQSPRTLAHLLLGALDEAALLLAHADDGGETRRAVEESIARSIEMLGPSDK